MFLLKKEDESKNIKNKTNETWIKKKKKNNRIYEVQKKKKKKKKKPK